MNKTTSLFDLSGCVAVVTGGNGGIGRSIALGLASAGAAVAVLARDEMKNRQVLADLQATGRPAFVLHTDVTDRAALGPALLEVERALNGLDILVNNAGIALPGRGLIGQTIEDWDVTIETHLNASFLLSQLAAKSMINRRRGKIINLASMYSFFGSGVAPAYSAAKGAVVQLTKSMAIDLVRYNIQVNAIAPGWIATELTARVRNSTMNDAILARTPANRWGQPEDIAGAAVFLSSRAADFITGVTLPVDGGYSVR